jgi:hypothetical protein
MDFRCRTSWIHSGKKAYQEGNVYPLSREHIAELVAIKDKKSPLGALKYFEPIGEEARDYLAGMGRKKTDSGKDEVDSSKKKTGPGSPLGKKKAAPEKQESENSATDGQTVPAEELAKE